MSSPEGRFTRGAVLRAEGLSVRLGNALILDGVNIEVNPRELVGLVGPNGAGKTVLFDCLSGLVPVSAGSVFLGDDRVTDAPAFWRVWHGLGRTFQEGRLFESLPVEVNVALAACIHSGSFISDGFSMPWSVLGRREMLGRARDALGVVDAGHLWGRPAASLAGPDRRRVEIARALCARPSVLLLDEPAAGLEAGALDLGRLVMRLRDELGIAVMLVEHDPALVFSICDFVYALDAGTVVTSGPPATVREDPELRRSYLGVG